MKDLLNELWLDPDDAHDLDLAVGVVVQPGAPAQHLVRAPRKKCSDRSTYIKAYHSFATFREIIKNDGQAKGPIIQPTYRQLTNKTYI